MFNNLAMFESPVQWMFVLVIALIVFGPKRLPEIGKQLGQALRELKKATGDMAKTFNTDYEPDPEPYRYQPESEYNADSSYSNEPATQAPLDLTDYTIVGAPGAGAAAESDPYALAPANTVARQADGSAPEAAQGEEPAQAVAAASATHSESAKQGEQNV